MLYKGFIYDAHAQGEYETSVNSGNVSHLKAAHVVATLAKSLEGG